MDYWCIGCGKMYGHKTGLNNHWHTCHKWNNLDRVAKHKKKRLEMQSMGLVSSQAPSGIPDLAQSDNLVCILPLLTNANDNNLYRIEYT